LESLLRKWVLMNLKWFLLINNLNDNKIIKH
jgi:hypothetical protein